MTKKNSWLSFMAVFLFLLNSCVHDEIYSASASEEYHSKSIFKEDEKYIKNVMKIYSEHEQEIKNQNGIPLWDYAMTMGNFDESFLIVPVVAGNTVVSCMQVPRKGEFISFRSDNDLQHIRFFQAYITTKQKKAVKQELLASAAKGLKECSFTAVSMWYPDSEQFPDGPGHWETSYITTCPNADDGMSDGVCSGYYDANGNCVPGYPYPVGGGGNNPQQPQNPCEKTKNIVNNSNLKTKIDELKNFSLTAVRDEMGYHQDKSGNVTPADVNGAHLVEFTIDQNSLGGIHSHTLNGGHMFSPKDILTFLNFARVQNQTLPIGSTADNTGNAYLGMIAQSATYFITFNGGNGDLPPPMTQAEEDAFELKLNGEYKKIVIKLLKAEGKSKNDDLSEAGLQKLFFGIIKVMDLEGKINLIKENNGNTSTIQQSSDGTIKAPIPC